MSSASIGMRMAFRSGWQALQPALATVTVPLHRSLCLVWRPCRPSAGMKPHASVVSQSPGAPVSVRTALSRGREIGRWSDCCHRFSWSTILRVLRASFLVHFLTENFSWKRRTGMTPSKALKNAPRERSSPYA